MKAAEFINSLSRIETELETLSGTAVKLQRLDAWLAETHGLENALLLDFQTGELFAAGGLESEAFDLGTLLEYARSLPADPSVVLPAPREALILGPALDGAKSFVHLPLMGENGQVLGALLLFTQKPKDYFDSRKSELFLVARRMRDLLLIGNLAHLPNDSAGKPENRGTDDQKPDRDIPVTARHFIGMMNYPMFIMNEAGQVLTVNNALLSKLRYANFAEFSRRADLFQDLSRRGEILRLLEREGGVRCRRITVHASNGDQLAVNLSLARLGGMVVGSLFDISEYVRVTDDLRESLKMQEFLNDKLISAALLLNKTQSSAIRSLARLAEFRDHETGDHLQRIREYSRLIAREVFQRQPFDFKIRSEYCDDIFLSSMLHDIGKVGIPDHILLKKGKLDEEEWKIMKSHTVIGWTILNQADCELGEQSFLTLASQIALNHHERWDGSGYPNGLAGDKIPLSARISAVADVYDALTSQRPYKKPWHHDDAIREIRSQSGASFDPAIVDILMSVEKKMLDVHYRFPK